MKIVSGKRLAKLAESKGWSLARVNGSHHIYVKEGRTERVVIPVHGNQDLKGGLLRSLMKIIPIDESELQSPTRGWWRFRCAERHSQSLANFQNDRKGLECYLATEPEN